MIGIVLVCLLLGFQTVLAGTCGKNVKYTISGDTISFSKRNSGSDAVWGTDCTEVFKEDSNITIIKVNEKILVTNGNSLFRDCQYVQEMDLEKLDVSAVTNMISMFDGCWELRSVDVSGWDTSNVTNMSSMFNECNFLESVDVSEWDTSNVTAMSLMFRYCWALESLDVSGWVTSNAKFLNDMFYDSGVKSLDVGGWDTSKVTNMNGMFHGCSGLTSLDVSGWDTSNVTGMGGMFAYCSGLTSLDVSRWDTSNVTEMGCLYEGWDGIFSGCTSLTSIDVSGWNISKVTSTGSMFDGCSSLTSVDVSRWDTSGVTDMSWMFHGCSGLKSLDVSGWDTSKVTSMGSMFSGCSSLDMLLLGRNTLQKNIFTTLPKYKSTWYYIVQGAAAGNPLQLKTAKANASLFTAYNSNTMAGTWAVSMQPAASITISNENSVTLNGKSALTNRSRYQVNAAAKPAAALQEFSWISSDPETASVNAAGRVDFKKPGTVKITVTARDGSGVKASFNLKYDPIKATKIFIYNKNNSLLNDKTYTTKKPVHLLWANAQPSSALQIFDWTSSNTNIATVNSSGKLTFVKGGTVTVTVSARDGSGVKASFKLSYRTETKNIVIRNANNVTINNKTALTNRSMYQVNAAAEPAGAQQIFDWESSDPNTADVNASGRVDFKKIGTVTITVKAKDGSGVKASFKLKYDPIKATKIFIYNENNSLLNDRTFSTSQAVYQLKANAQPSSALQTFGWVSSDTSVGSVDIYGKLSFRKLGSTMITVNARDGSGQKSHFTVTYKPIKTKKLNVYSPEGNVINGKSITTKTRIYKMSGAAQPAEALQIFSWTSSDTNIATVNVYGVVGFKKPGTVTIRVGTRDASGHKTTVKLTYAP